MTDTAATTSVLTIFTTWARATGHTLALGVTVVCAITYAAIIGKTIRWRAQTRATRRAFAKLPADRQTAALTEYNELRQNSPTLFPHPVPARLVRVG